MAFTSKQLITSNNDLIKYLKKTPKAYQLINKGKFIINYDKLQHISPERFSGKKMAIILNSLHSNNVENVDNVGCAGSVGHWILLLFNIRKKECLLIENLAYVYKNCMNIKLHQFPSPPGTRSFILRHSLYLRYRPVSYS